MIKFVEKKRTAWFAMPLYFTTYTITEEMLNVKKGFFKITENDCYLYKIQDVSMTKTLIERLFKLSTIRNVPFICNREKERRCFCNKIEKKLTNVRKSVDTNGNKW